MQLQTQALCTILYVLCQAFHTSPIIYGLIPGDQDSNIRASERTFTETTSFPNMDAGSQNLLPSNKYLTDKKESERDERHIHHKWHYLLHPSHNPDPNERERLSDLDENEDSVIIFG
ncbi:hypothetical protein Ddc_06970 [Ditylenchus destructor]|nr:hypothetical protein Ddc_06970 [Ditylenchus destructor]